MNDSANRIKYFLLEDVIYCVLSGKHQLTMGVITTSRLPEGVTLGPVPPTVTLADPIVLIGHRTSDTPPDIHTVKVRVIHECN